MCFGVLVYEVYLWSLFFSSGRRHTRFDCDWSSDVCSSDLAAAAQPGPVQGTGRQHEGWPVRQLAAGPAHGSVPSTSLSACTAAGSSPASMAPKPMTRARLGGAGMVVVGQAGGGDTALGRGSPHLVLPAAASQPRGDVQACPGRDGCEVGAQRPGQRGLQDPVPLAIDPPGPAQVLVELPVAD